MKKENLANFKNNISRFFLYQLIIFFFFYFNFKRNEGLLIFNISNPHKIQYI